MPRDAAPPSYDAFRTRMDERLVNGEAFLTDEARLVGGYLAGSAGYPLPGPAVIGSPGLAAVVVGSLPASVRRMYGMRMTPAQKIAFATICRGSRAVHQGLPGLAASPLFAGPSRPSYASVAATEARQRRRGKVSMPGVSDVPAPYQGAPTH